MKLTPLSKDHHQDLYLSAQTSFKFLSQLTSMPITLYDLPLLATQLPTAFVKVGESFELRIICGIEQDENLCVGLDNAVWHLKAFPSLYKSYPFVLGASGDKFILCFDESSERINRKKDGQRVFEENGELSNMAKKAWDDLQRIEKDKLLTISAATELVKKAVLEPWPLEIEIQGEKKILKGLHKVSEPSLSKLSDPEFLELRKQGALPLAYLHLSSIQNVPLLSMLKNRRVKELAIRPPQSEITKRADKDFILSEDGLIDFDI